MAKLIVAFILVVAGLTETTTAQTPEATDWRDGVVMLAAREFGRSGSDPAGVDVAIAVLETESVDAAASAFDHVVAERVVGLDSVEPMAETSAPRLGDRSVVHTGVLDQHDVATAVIQVDRYIFAMMGAARSGDPLPVILDLARMVTAPERFESVLVDGDAKALLPTLDEMPPGYVVRLERSATPPAAPTN